jgi:hypothetical protein
MSRAPGSAGRSTGRTTPRQHLRRAVGADRNPLCRSIDRAYSRNAVGLVAALIASVLLALLAGALVLRAQQATARWESAHRHQAMATTLGPATSGGSGTEFGYSGDRARAAWTYPGSARATGWVEVPPGTPAGRTLPVWLDDAGRPAAAPRTGVMLVGQAALTGIGVLGGLTSVSVATAGLRSRVLDRRAASSWEAAWRQVEPQWSGRRRREHGSADQ